MRKEKKIPSCNNSVISILFLWTSLIVILCTYLGKTFSFPVTMIEGGLDTLDKVEAGDVDAEDALEFGVKIGEENTGAAAGTMNRILCLKFVLNPLTRKK